MAKGSTSQTSTNVARGGRGGAPPGASVSSGGLRRRAGSVLFLTNLAERMGFKVVVLAQVASEAVYPKAF